MAGGQLCMDRTGVTASIPWAALADATDVMFTHPADHSLPKFPLKCERQPPSSPLHQLPTSHVSAPVKYRWSPHPLCKPQGSLQVPPKTG